MNRIVFPRPRLEKRDCEQCQDANAHSPCGSETRMITWQLGSWGIDYLERGDLWGDGASLIFPERQMIPSIFTEHTVLRAES